MSATYAPELTTDRDWVRFLVGDTVVASAVVSDEEITAVLAEQTSPSPASRYFAAAEILETLLTKWTTAGRGVVEKQVQGLRIRTGLDGTSARAVEERVKFLRARGARLVSQRPFHLKVLGYRNSPYLLVLALLWAGVANAQSGVGGIAVSALPVRSTVAALPDATTADHGLRIVTDDGDCDVDTDDDGVVLCLDTGIRWETTAAAAGISIAENLHTSCAEGAGIFSDGAGEMNCGDGLRSTAGEFHLDLAGSGSGTWEVNVSGQPFAELQLSDADGFVVWTLDTFTDTIATAVNDGATSTTLTQSAASLDLADGALTVDGTAVVLDDDARLTDARTPTGSAGGDLTGTYPSPTIAANSVALGTDTTGNYAAGDAEAGAALTGDSATDFFSSGTVNAARLGSGTPDSTTYLRGDSTWATVTAGIGGSTGATDNAVLRADGTGGTTLQASGVTISDSPTVVAVAGSSNDGSGLVLGAPSTSGIKLSWVSDSGTPMLVIAGGDGSQARTRVTKGLHVLMSSANPRAIIDNDKGGFRIYRDAAICFSSNNDNVTDNNCDTSSTRASAGLWKLSDALQLTGRSAPICTCGGAGCTDAIYADSDGSRALCWCDGTAWVVVAGAGACS